jgi:hypothetical protein
MCELMEGGGGRHAGPQARQTPALQHGSGSTESGAGGKAAAVAPCSGALIPETAILTDPHSLLTRNQANVPYLKNAPRMSRRSIFE